MIFYNGKSAYYIYCDLNVIKYIVSPVKKYQQDIQKILEKISKLRAANFLFPFSEAHFQDRLNRFDSDYEEELQKELNNFQNIFGNVKIGYFEKADKRELACCDKNIKESLEEFRKDYFANKRQVLNPSIIPSIQPFLFDKSQLDTRNPLYDFFIENPSINCMDNITLYKLCEWMYNRIFVDVELYKRVRNYSTSMDEINTNIEQQTPLNRFMACILFGKMKYLFDLLDKPKEDLINNLKQATRSWLSLSPNMTKMDECDQMVNAYMLLDFHENYHDKLKKNKNTLDNIRRDANHIYWASDALYYVTEDNHTRYKAELIYKAYGKRTKVINIEEFMSI